MSESVITKSKSSAPVTGSIKVLEQPGITTLTIPARGVRGNALVTLMVIALWLFTIMVFTVFLFLMKPVMALYSLPFWAIGIWTFLKSFSMIRLEQSIDLQKDSLTLKMKQGNKADEMSFPVKDIKISFVEGSFHTYTGLSKRGQYPAIIYKEESFGFAERCSAEEKKWLLNYINDYYNTK